MKRIIILIIMIFITLISFGCKANKYSALNYDDALEEEEEIKYKTDQVLLSKSFQSTEPSVEILSKNTKLKVLASLGLTESSGVEINKIIKRGSEIDIHVTSTYDEDNLQLAVPQVLLELKNLEIRKIDDIKFNIVNSDYRPLKVKLGINEALSKVQSHFKILPIGSPSISLTRLNESILWNISYNNIFDKESPSIPLINLFTLVDANSGDIKEYKKTFVSSSIDDGYVLSHVSDNYLLYKKPVVDKETNKTTEQLWYYDAKSNEKEMIFSSSFKILSAQYSNDLSYVSLIESNDNDTELYVIPREDKRAYKITFENKFNPKIMRWQDDNKLYLLENTDTGSIVYSYQVKDNKSDLVGRSNRMFENLIIDGDTFLVIESSDDFNKKISSTLDWQIFDFENYGYNPKFINSNTIGYLKKDEKVDSSSLIIYDIKDNKSIHQIEGNISTFQVLPDNEITYVNKNNNHNDFNLSKYSLDSEETTNIGQLISDKIYHDKGQDKIYINLTLPFENDRPELIYSINLADLN